MNKSRAKAWAEVAIRHARLPLQVHMQVRQWHEPYTELVAVLVNADDEYTREDILDALHELRRMVDDEIECFGRRATEGQMPLHLQER